MNAAQEKWQHTTIRIETRSQDDAYFSGTAFVYEYATPTSKIYPFLITTKQLIKHAREGRMTFIQGQNGVPLIGEGYTLDVEHFSKLWFSHSDESLNIAIAPFMPFVQHLEGVDVSLYFASLKKADLVNAEASLNVGDEVVYLGYPDDCWDRKTLSPVFRRGMVSTSPSALYQGFNQFLLDTTVLKGSSGSPVFCLDNSFNKASSGRLNGRLLGMLSNLPKVIDDGKTETVSYDAALETPMGVVINMDAVIQVIEAYLAHQELC